MAGFVLPLAALIAQASVEVQPPEDRTCRIEIRAEMSADAYARTDAEMKAAGLALDREAISGAGHFAALWSNAPGVPRVSRGAHGYDAFYRISLDMIGKDYRMADLAVGMVDGSPYYSALWEQGRDHQQSVSYWLSEAELTRELTVKGRGILAIAPFEAGGRQYFAALFEADASDSIGLTGLTRAALNRADAKIARERSLARYRTYIYGQGKRTRYAAIWHAIPEYRRAPQCETGLPDWADAVWK